MKTLRIVLVALAVLALLLVVDGAPTAAAQPTVIATIPVGWDWHPLGVAANPTTNLIYVANTGYASRNVSVIDGATNTVVGDPIPMGAGPIGVAVNPATNRIYVANYYEGDNVSVIDGATNTVVATVPIADGSFGPFAVAVNPTTNLIYVTDLDSSVSVIDGTSDSVVATVAVGDSPRGITANPTTNRIYVANYEDDTLSVIEDLGPDSDGDGVPDGSDLCPDTPPAAQVDGNGCSDGQVDGDDDGVCDPGAASAGPSQCQLDPPDNCPNVYNPGQEDSNGNGIGDACEAVGGIAELPDASSSAGRNYAALAGLAAAALVALSAGGWYARRRWLG